MEKNAAHRSCAHAFHVLFLYIVTKLLKLVLFFSLCFALLFLISTGLRFLTLRVEWIRTLSQEQGAILSDLIIAAQWSLSLCLYGGILIGLSYVVRKEVFAPIALPCIALLTIVFIWGIGELVENLKHIPSDKTHERPLGEPGLILANMIRPAGTVIILLEGPDDPNGSRVVATPDRPLLYQEEFPGKNLALTNLPPAPFIDDCPWFLKSLAIDLRLDAELLRHHLDKGLPLFVVHAGSLIFLLCSLIFILKLSLWPLMNLFLGCLTFRGILALEIFFNTPEMQDVFDSFLQGRLPLTIVIPLIFCGVGLLIYLYSFLVYLAKGRRRHGN